MASGKDFPPAPDGWLLVGAILGAHGLKGEVKIKTFTQTPMALLDLPEVFLDPQGAPIKILSARPDKKDVIAAKLDGVTGRDQAEALKGKQLMVARTALPEADGEEDEYYMADLIGLEVVSAIDGALLGRIKQVVEYGASEILEIATPDDGPIRMLPFTREAAPEVKIAEGKLVADPDFLA